MALTILKILEKESPEVLKRKICLKRRDEFLASHARNAQLRDHDLRRTIFAFHSNSARNECSRDRRKKKFSSHPDLEARRRHERCARVFNGAMENDAGTFSRASDAPADNGVYQRNPAMSIRHHRERKSETHFSAIRPPRALSGREARRSRVRIRVAQLPSLTEADGTATPSLLRLYPANRGIMEESLLHAGVVARARRFPCIFAARFLERCISQAFREYRGKGRAFSNSTFRYGFHDRFSCRH